MSSHPCVPVEWQIIKESLWALSPPTCERGLWPVSAKAVRLCRMTMVGRAIYDDQGPCSRHSGMPVVKIISPCESSAPGAVPHPLPQSPRTVPLLTCFWCPPSRMSIRLIMMFLCVFLYFPTRSETVSQPGRPVHMKVLLPCSFHSRRPADTGRGWAGPPRDPLTAYSPAFRRRGGNSAFTCRQLFTEAWILPDTWRVGWWKAHWLTPLTLLG